MLSYGLFDGVARQDHPGERGGQGAVAVCRLGGRKSRASRARTHGPRGSGVPGSAI
ncbi:MAG: hypothetical protein L5656_09645 [Thermanaeromonas sp.]|uniref:hypothetical protein n=1 Tax=Thermanaeromonas sp. TaxID=2003697 RepID=UPI00243A7B67|nr:hypothetical protein [Thermanaeromonas sp.]MCG0278775.1 hypothetical protein [Thermanaeromonas sp.]